MKKLLPVLCLAVLLFACNQEAPKTEAVATAPTVVDSTKGTVDFAGPEIDLMKKLVSAIVKADFATAQSCYADSAMVWYNIWPGDTTQKGITVQQDMANAKELMETTWGNLSFGEPIYEVVTTASGDKYGHLWARVTGMNKKTKKPFDVPMFASFLIKDGKLQWEWNLHDSKRLE
jgi:hypothetical protein